jgi:tetratricopeptide (TPR) repeat protein
MGSTRMPRRCLPSYQNARYLLSSAYSRAGRYEEAVDSFTKFLQLRPRGRDACVLSGGGFDMTIN